MTPTLSTHLDVNALVYGGTDPLGLKEIQENAVLNVKRVFAYSVDWLKADAQGLHFISDVQEIKTIWHPIENVGGATSNY